MLRNENASVSIFLSTTIIGLDRQTTDTHELAAEDRGVLAEAKALEAEEEAPETAELAEAMAPEEELAPPAAASEELHEVEVPCWMVIWSE
jgi:hypothetical protein